MVLAAGFGSRLQPLTRILPKPMFPVLNRPILEHSLSLLKSHGIREIVINLHHLPDPVRDYFGSGESMGLKLHYSHEPVLLGTAGGIKAAEHFLSGDPFIVMNSDIFVDIDLGEVIRFHREKGSCLTLVLKPGDSPEQCDPIEIDPDGRVVHFVGGSSMDLPERTTRVTFTGIQIMEPEIFDRIPSGQFCGTTDSIFPDMVEEGKPTYGFVHHGYWRDMGTPASYLRLHRDLLTGQAPNLFQPTPLKEHAFTAQEPVFMGEGCQIAPSAKIGPNVTLGKNCRVGENAVVENTVCWDGVMVGERAQIHDCIVGHRVTLPPETDTQGKLWI